MNSNLEVININWTILGARLAKLSDTEQRRFFKGFASEMNNYETIHQRDMQLCYAATRGNGEPGLTVEESEVFSNLGGFGKDDHHKEE